MGFLKNNKEPREWNNCPSEWILNLGGLRGKDNKKEATISAKRREEIQKW